MGPLALRSLRHRPAAAIATFLAVLFGAALIGTFATLAESARSAHGADRTTLVVMGAVVGGWGAAIVLYSVASTVGIVTTQRAVETALLRAIGASRRQVRRLLASEILVVALAGVAVGAALAALGGRLLFGALRDGGVLSSAATYDGGALALGVTAALVLLTSLAAAALAGHRTTRGEAVAAFGDADLEPRRMPWWRVVVGVLLVGYGLAGATVTLTVTRHSADPYDAMASSGSGSIMVGLGLGVMSPWLLRVLVRPFRALVAVTPSGYLASYNATRRSHLLAGVLAPVIVLSAGAIGTLMIVGIDHRTMLTASPATTDDGRVINLLNYVVTGMIGLFAAIMVVNAFAAVISHRRSELQRLRLAGATRGQVERSIVAEAGLVAVVGIVLGALAALTSIVPFAIARHEGLVPDGQLWLPGVLAAGIAALTLASAAGAARRVTRGTAVQ